MTTIKITSETRCHTCLFKDNCLSASDLGCQNYTPENEEYELEEYIESRRQEFRDEWMQYIEEWD